MAPLRTKGDLAEAMVAADVLRRGYKVAWPHGEDWDFDLILGRPTGELELGGGRAVLHLRLAPARNAQRLRTRPAVDYLRL